MNKYAAMMIWGDYKPCGHTDDVSMDKQASLGKSAMDEHRQRVLEIIKTAEETPWQGAQTGNMGFWEHIVDALKRWWGGLGAQSREQRRQNWIASRTKELQSKIKNPNAYATDKWGAGDYLHTLAHPMGGLHQTARNKVFGGNRNRTSMGLGDYALFAVPGLGPTMGLHNAARIGINKAVAKARDWNYNRQMTNAEQQARDEAETKNW